MNTLQVEIALLSITPNAVLGKVLSTIRAIENSAQLLNQVKEHPTTRTAVQAAITTAFSVAATTSNWLSIARQLVDPASQREPTVSVHPDDRDDDFCVIED
jgi:hypothetical protein